MSSFWQFPHHFTYARDTAPVLYEPGKGYQYSNPGMAMLGWCITAAMKSAATPDIKRILIDRVYGPIGAAKTCGVPSYGGGKAVKLDGLSLYPTWGGTGATARGTARVGRLMLRKGDWDGKRVLSAKWIAEALKDSGGPPPDRKDDPSAPRSGLCWWLNVDGIWKGVPTDAFAGAGAQNQVLFVVPSLDLVAVRFGRGNLGKQFWQGLDDHMFRPLVAASEAKGAVQKGGVRKAAYPPSRLISAIAFDPIEKILRKGIDSDNWPITWADDGEQYPSFGDG